MKAEGLEPVTPSQWVRVAVGEVLAQGSPAGCDFFF